MVQSPLEPPPRLALDPRAWFQMTDRTLWDLGNHTRGKHLVLRGYLHAWLPILGTTQGKIVFVDGFAGPGEYTRGEPGSPMVALRAFLGHAAKHRISSTVKFLFIESVKPRAEHLERLVQPLRQELPEGCTADVRHGEFADVMGSVLDEIEDAKNRLAPALVMIDPFGVKDVPMEVIHRILRHPRCEVYVSFMFEAINRHIETREFEPHLDTLFGCKDWVGGIELTGEDRKVFLYDLYRRRLKDSGAEQVVHFDLYDGKRLKYAIFFATSNLDACDKMKQAVWKVDPEGSFAFRGSNTPTLDLWKDPNTDALADQLRALAEGRWVTVSELEDFVKSDRCDFTSNHLKRRTLQRLEKGKLLEVDTSKLATRRRGLSYPPRC